MKQGLDLQRVQFQQPDETVNIAVITWQPELYSNQRFLIAAHELNKTISFLNPDQLKNPSSQTHYLVRLGSYQFKESLEKLKAWNLKYCNPLILFERYRNKIQTLQIWQANNIPYPKSVILDRKAKRVLDLNQKTLWEGSISQTNELFFILCQFLSNSTTYPEKEFVLKVPTAIKGQGVFLIQSPEELQKTIDTLHRNFTEVNLTHFLVQKYYPESHGEDIRVLQVRNESFSIRRKNLHDFRSNLAQGGMAFNYQLLQEEENLCTKVFNLSQLTYAGIDFIRTKDGPMFLEINVSPGFEGIEKTLNIDIAKKILSASF